MKKIVLLLSFIVSFTSCQNEVEFNNPALQGSINNVFWKSNSTVAAKNASGNLTIYGRGQTGDLTIKLATANLGTYELGTTNQSNAVTFLQIGTGGGEFTTGLNANPANSISLASGGTGYIASNSESTSGGTGSGLKVATTVNASGNITSAVITSPGTGYTPGDLVTIIGGNQDAMVRINSVANSNGKVIITENTGVTISGSFSFTAYDAVTKQTANCRQGVFYKIPIQ